MQQANEKRLLLIAFVILLLGFFSTAFTGLHHAGTTSAGPGSYSVGSWSKADIKLAESYIRQGIFKTYYDLNSDNKLDGADIELMKTKLYKPRQLRGECAKENEKWCNPDSTMSICQRSEVNDLEIVKVAPPVKGMICKQKDPNLRTGKRSRTAEFIYKFSG